MLRIYYGELNDDKYISVPDIFFDNTYEDDWITDELSVEMIKDVDKSDVVGPHLIDSPFLGPISPERLSGGVKTLMLINNDPDHIFNASACGDNCAKWILKISNDKDITIRLGYLMDFGNDEMNIEIVNTGDVVHSLAELNEAVLKAELI